VLDSGEQSVVEYVVPTGQSLALLCHIPGHIEKGMVGAVELRDIESAPDATPTALHAALPGRPPRRDRTLTTPWLR
jgi:hypothetical protein